MKTKLQQSVDVIVVESIRCCEYTERRHQIKLNGSKKAFFPKEDFCAHSSSTVIIDSTS